MWEQPQLNIVKRINTEHSIKVERFKQKSRTNYFL